MGPVYTEIQASFQQEQDVFYTDTCGHDHLHIERYPTPKSDRLTGWYVCNHCGERFMMR